jgi:hypothetical protein
MHLKAAETHDMGNGIPLLQNWAAYTAAQKSVFGSGIYCLVYIQMKRLPKHCCWTMYDAAQNYGYR